MPGFLRQLGLTVVPQGRSFGMDYCPKCQYGEHRGGNKVSIFVAEDGLWRWKCYSCNTSPSTLIDFAAQHWGCSDREAVDRINSANIPDIPTSGPQAPLPETDKVMASVLTKLRKNARCATAKKYLGSRGIPETVIDEAFSRGLVYSYHSDPHEARHFLTEIVGFEMLRKAGLMKPNKTWPAIAFRPLVFPLGNDGAEFRLTRAPTGNEPKSIRYGKLHHPWWWKSQESAKATLVVEGAIDGLSAIAMGWKGHVLSIPGASSWREDWFSGILQKYPNTIFYLGMDPDAAGDLASENIACFLKNIGAQANRVRLSDGMDWNKSLQSGVKPDFSGCF